MKKVLFATTAIVLTAGAAAAQNVTISGAARVGLLYQEDSGGFRDTNNNGVRDPGEADGRDTQVNTRLRFNFDASKETDSGVTFGGRIRMQYDSNNNQGFGELNTAGGPVPVERGAARLNAAYVYAEYEGLRVEVGNANTAFDSVALLYNAEIGYIGQTFGSYAKQSYYSYSTNAYGQGQFRRMGVYAAYSIAGFNVKASYITPDQRFSDVNEEFSMAADYNFGAFTVAAAFALDAASTNDYNVFFVGGEYAINPDANVGLHINYTDDGRANVPGVFAFDDNTMVTLYGNYKFGAITGRGYLAYNDDNANQSDVAVGVGADYDLGGATMAGHIARGFNEEIQASLGVKFSF